MSITLRPANLEEDPPAVAAIINAVDAHPVDAAQVRAWFTHLPEGRVSRRRVAVEDDGGQVVGYSAVVHEAYFPPGEYYVWTAVRPEKRGRGTGSALYGDALDFLRQQGAAHLRSEVREDCLEGRRFAERYGFTVNRHLFESVLDLPGFDETPYLPMLERLEAEGVRFFSMADTPDDEAARHKLYELNLAVGLDVPGAEEFPSYEEFDGLLFRAPWYQPEGQLLAAVGEQWVGQTSVQIMPEVGGAYNIMTGVLRAFRGRKIARGLKVHAVRYARQHGALWMRTDNDSLNAPMLAINREMGYRPQPGKFTLAREME